MVEPDVQAIVAGLSPSDRNALLGAQLADSHEYWLTSPVADKRLASSDWVLTPLGLAAHRYLQSGAPA